MNIRIKINKHTAYNFMFGRKNQYALFSLIEEDLDPITSKTIFAWVKLSWGDNHD